MIATETSQTELQGFAEPVARGARLAGVGLIATIGFSAVVLLVMSALGAEVVVLRSVLWGAVVVLLGSWGASLLVALKLDCQPSHVAGWILAGLGVRFAVTVLLTLVVMMQADVARNALLLSVGGLHFAVLACDMWALLRVTRSLSWEAS